jgi:hypothetical protein
VPRGFSFQCRILACRIASSPANQGDHDAIAGLRTGMQLSVLGFGRHSRVNRDDCPDECAIISDQKIGIKSALILLSHNGNYPTRHCHFVPCACRLI